MSAVKTIKTKYLMHLDVIVLFNMRNKLCLSGGAEEDRTPDLLRARQALSQLSYGPFA